MTTRRHFLNSAVMTMIAARFGTLGTADAAERASRELNALGRATDWINSPRLTPEHLAGRVVLIDFWTYTCINWLRTLPYIRAWSEKYGQHMLVIGVHTPEFPFERNTDNVRRAVKHLRIEYPVVIDNDYSIWRAFDNHYWPALYFVDARGRVRQHQFGEGQYEQSELAIQRLLAEAGTPAIAESILPIEGQGIEAPADWGNLKSGENYLGYERTQNFVSPGGFDFDRRHLYAAPKRLDLNQWALVGDWAAGRQAAVLGSPQGRIVYRVHARDVHVVLSPARPGSTVRFRVSIDNQPPGAAHGLDINEHGDGTVVEPRLYQLIRQSKPIVDRQVAIEFLDGGVEAYAFTFG